MPDHRWKIGQQNIHLNGQEHLSIANYTTSSLRQVFKNYQLNVVKCYLAAIIAPPIIMKTVNCMDEEATFLIKKQTFVS
jgi:hypothetical protein